MLLEVQAALAFSQSQSKTLNHIPATEVVRFKFLYLLAIWEGEAGEAPAELLRHGSAGASPSRPMNLQVAKPDDLSGRVTKSVNYRF